MAFTSSSRRGVPPTPTLPTGVQIASFDTYLEAQRAVDLLSDKEFEVQHTTIVGTDLRMVERITGRLSYPRVALAGAMSGAWFGLFVGLIFGLLSEGGIFVMMFPALIIGAAFGILFALVSYAFTGGKRDFTSSSQVVAGRYGLLCEQSRVGEAMRLLGEAGIRTRVGADAPAAVGSRQGPPGPYGAQAQQGQPGPGPYGAQGRPGPYGAQRPPGDPQASAPYGARGPQGPGPYGAQGPAGGPQAPGPYGAQRPDGGPQGPGPYGAQRPDGGPQAPGPYGAQGPAGGPQAPGPYGAQRPDGDPQAPGPYGAQRAPDGSPPTAEEPEDAQAETPSSSSRGFTPWEDEHGNPRYGQRRASDPRDSEEQPS